MPGHNCWEALKCGREPGGEKATDVGVCPATCETRLHGVNNGRNAGRACWIITGTLSNDEVQGTFAQKFGTCMKCEFYKLVQEEEGAGYIKSREIVKKLVG